MATVGVRALKNRLTEYLRRSKGGEEIVVTERGTPIAVIQPIGSVPTVASLEAGLARLAAQGLVTLPRGNPRKRMPRVRIAGPALSRMIVDDRERTTSTRAR